MFRRICNPAVIIFVDNRFFFMKLIIRVTSEVADPVTQQFLVTGGVAGGGESVANPHSLNPASLLGRKSRERKDGDWKRRLSERSEFLRFRRTSFHSRPKSAAGDFSFCYLFLFFGKKKKQIPTMHYSTD